MVNLPGMISLLEQVETLVAGTPLESTARRFWREIWSIGRPRARQSVRYDRQTDQIMSRVLKEDSNCVDIGCHRGSALLSMLRFAPRGKHLAFEPLPMLAQRLRERFPNVKIHEMALSDGPGEDTFLHVLTSPGLSGFRMMGHVSAAAQVEEITVRKERFDDILPEGMRVDFMKVDVEGAQLEVLRGAERTITRQKPFIVFEHGKLAEEAYGTTSDVMYDYLVGKCGLRISLLSDWLSEGSALRREEFSGHVGYHAGSHFCFLAHP